jgi:hypothetical protein
MKIIVVYLITGLFLLSAGCNRPGNKGSTGVSADAVPVFKVDPFWPKPLPDDWLLGQVSGVDVDSRDHVWIIHRPGRLGDDEDIPLSPPVKIPYTPAPPVLEFDAGGNVVRSWGGPGEGYEWPESEHGIFIDHQDNVWISGGSYNDHQVLKFRPDGTFLLQIGKAGKTGGSNDTALLGRPTEFDVDPAANEVYIADGYLNHRVIVFDAVTGEYKRHWGAYGKRPDDAAQEAYAPDMPPAQQFGDAVHAVRVSSDGSVYVCDRANNRIQVFDKEGEFIREGFVSRQTTGLGTAWDIGFSPDPLQTFLYVADGTNQCIRILRREDLEVAGQFGRIGRYAGQFMWVHSLAVDSKGNIYTGEVRSGKRVQKFCLQTDRSGMK